MENQKEHSSRRYAVFISYRHADNKEAGRQWATWLHQTLEGYEIPADLVGAKNSKGDVIPENLYPVFRDEEELPADADLTSNIRQALDNSGLLVVLCSPRAVESTFVADEIRYFKEIGKAGRILALLIDGEPNVKDDKGKLKAGLKPEAECLPEPLRYGTVGPDGKIDWSRPTEPIAADVRPEGNPEQGWTTGAAYRENLHKGGKLKEREITQRVRDYEQRLELAKLKIVAGSLGVPLGELTQRDKVMQLRKARQRARMLRLWLTAVGVLAIAALVGGIYAWSKRQEAIAQRQVAEAQRKEALDTASETDFSIAILKMEKEDWPSTLAYLADAMRKNPQNEKAMVLAVSSIRGLTLPIAVIKPIYPPSRSFGVVSQASASFSPDGKWVLTSIFLEHAQVWDARTGRPVSPPIGKNVTSASFSPDGKSVVTSGGEIAQVWDAQTGQPVGQPMRHNGGVNFASFSPDGRRVVTASRDKTARVWDAQTGQPISEPMNHEGVSEYPDKNVFYATFSPNGKWVVTASENQSARVWDAQTGKPVSKPMRHGNSVVAANFSPDGKLVVTASYDKTARIWDAQTGEPVGSPMKCDDIVNSASFSPDGKVVITVTTDTAQVWDVKKNRPVGKAMRQDDLWTAEFSPDGKWVLTASGDHTAQLWNARNGEEVGLPLPHDDAVQSASFSPDGKLVVTASKDKTARVWNIPNDQPRGSPLQYGATNYSPDGMRIVRLISGSAQICDAQTGQPVGSAMGNQVSSTTFSSDGRWVVAVFKDHTTRVWDAKTGGPVGQPVRTNFDVSSAGLSPNGKQLLTLTGGVAQIWDIQTGRPVGTPLDDDVASTCFSPNGEWVVTASSNRIARVWNARTGQPVSPPMKHDDGVTFASFSPDSRCLLTGSGINARVWDAQTGRPLSPLIAHEKTITSARFGPDGKSVMTAAAYVAQVWDAKTGLRLGRPMEHDEFVNDASFSPDGKWIVTASDDSTRVWDAATGYPVIQPMKNDDAMIYGSVVWSAEFLSDNKWVMTVPADRIKRLWDVVIADDNAPPWLDELAEVAGGRRLMLHGVLEPTPKSPMECRMELQKLSGNDDLARFGRWVAANPSERTIGPLSTFTIPDFVAARLQENTLVAVEEAYSADPGNPLALAALAKLTFESDKNEAQFYFQIALRYARLAGAPEQISQVQSMAKSLFPEDPEFSSPAPGGKL